MARTSAERGNGEDPNVCKPEWGDTEHGAEAPTVQERGAGCFSQHFLPRFREHAGRDGKSSSFILRAK